MSEFIWLDDYKIGNETVDQQHQYLFKLANQVVEAADTETLIRDAMLLYRHVREHFQAEEALMKQYNYPGYTEHVEAHNQMLEKLILISDSLHNRTWNPEDILVFMRGWVLVHILEVDSLLGEFLQKQAK